jgi:hypothetical protein
MISLMNGKPVEALRALNTTRLIELPGDVKRARLLLEAKALSDLSRTDQAIELAGSERGPEVDRLRSDIFWTGQALARGRRGSMNACSAKAGVARHAAQRRRARRRDAQRDFLCHVE